MREWSKVVYQDIKLPFIKFAVKCGFSANQVTIFNHVLTLTFGCWFFSRGTYLFGLAGLGICIINGILDYLDGDLARINKTHSKLGAWLDSGFDVIVQNAVLGAIAIGCFKMGMPLIWVVMFAIGNSANNFVSFHYNHKFGFDSASGNEVFRNGMDEKPGLQNIILKQMIDPTSDYFALVIYTYRYFIVVGAVFGLMPLMFMIMTVIANVKWFVMYSIYAFYLGGEKGLHVLRVLKGLDDEEEEHFRLRHGE